MTRRQKTALHELAEGVHTLIMAGLAATLYADGHWVLCVLAVVVGIVR